MKGVHRQVKLENSIFVNDIKCIFLFFVTVLVVSIKNISVKFNISIKNKQIKNNLYSKKIKICICTVSML